MINWYTHWSQLKMKHKIYIHTQCSNCSYKHPSFLRAASCWQWHRIKSTPGYCFSFPHLPFSFGFFLLFFVSAWVSKLFLTYAVGSMFEVTMSHILYFTARILTSYTMPWNCPLSINHLVLCRIFVSQQYYILTSYHILFPLPFLLTSNHTFLNWLRFFNMSSISSWITPFLLFS